MLLSGYFLYLVPLPYLSVGVRTLTPPDPQDKSKETVNLTWTYFSFSVCAPLHLFHTKTVLLLTSCFFAPTSQMTDCFAKVNVSTTKVVGLTRCPLLLSCLTTVWGCEIRVFPFSLVVSYVGPERIQTVCLNIYTETVRVCSVPFRFRFCFQTESDISMLLDETLSLSKMKVPVSSLLTSFHGRELPGTGCVLSCYGSVFFTLLT